MMIPNSDRLAIARRRVVPLRPADVTAFQRLFDAHFDELSRYVRTFVWSREESEDLVHDVFLRVWDARAAIPLQGDLRPYLYAAARNRALDRLRHRRVEERWEQHAIPIPVTDAGTPPQSDGEQQAEFDDMIAAVERAVASLPTRQREVLLLRWRNQWSYEEIGAKLGVSAKTVATHMSRALDHLRQALSPLVD